MELKFKEFNSYKHLTEKDLKSDYYKPEYAFDLSLLPTLSLQEQLAPFILERGNTLAFLSLYIDRISYMLFAEFISTCYPDLESMLDLDVESAIARMIGFLHDKGINPRRQKKDGYNLHPAIRYINQAHFYCLPKDNFIFYRDLDCYKDVPKKKQSSAHYHPEYFFNLNVLPSSLIEEFREFITARGKELSFTSITNERRCFGHIADFLCDTYPSIKSLYDLDKDSCIRKYKIWAMKHQIPLTIISNKRNKLHPETKIHPFFKYLKTILSYFTYDDGLFHFEDDIWILDRLDFPVRRPPVNTIASINFENILQDKMKAETKKAILFRLKEVSARTSVNDVHVINVFTEYLARDYPQIESFAEIDREVIESYLIYINTEDTRRKNYRTELNQLKSILATIGLVIDEYSLMKLFFPEDIPKDNIPVFRFYTDNELETLNRGFKTLDPQTGRLMILHEILGCRISETLTLRTDCIREDENGHLYITIHQAKVNRSYRKPINDDIKNLIESAIAYTTSHYGPRDYIFVDDNNPDKPMTYGAMYYRVQCMIIENDLRDDHGELFTVSTHLFRKTYGKRLCDMGLDDSIIAKLLGHANTSSVKHYRRMTSKVLAEGTKKLREEKDKTINKYKGGWN